MYRAKNGLDTNFDGNDDLIRMLSERLALLEKKSELDPDCCDADMKTRQTMIDLPQRAEHFSSSADIKNKATGKKYSQGQQKAWKEIIASAESLNNQFLESCPVKRGMEIKA